MKKKISRFLKKIVSPAKKRSAKPVVVPRSDHCISRRNIDSDALKVIYRLNRAGFDAYLVGGGVRDLLLGRTPKDFDVSTEAHPNQIKRLFRNCFLVGRRFRLAHVRFGDKIIETSTFRREIPPEAPSGAENHTLLQKRCNTFGTPDEDARLRDFTINALFYDVRTFSVIDHVGGLRDLDRSLIRCIGDPGVRFQEDPVRMVRAIRFASRLGFTIEKKTLAAIRTHCREIGKASPPRLIEEVCRLFGFGTGQAAIRMLAETGLLNVILPEVAACAGTPEQGNALFWEMLAAYDAVTPVPEVRRETGIFAALFYPLFNARIHRDADSGLPKVHQLLAREVIEAAKGDLPVPRMVVDRLVRAFDAQRRFESSSRRFSKRRFVLQPSFPESLLLHELILRARGEDLASLQPWRRLRKESLAQEEKKARQESKTAASATPSGKGATADTSDRERADTEKPAPRRRRRRPPRRSRPRPQIKV